MIMVERRSKFSECNNNVLKVVYDSNENPWLIITAHFDRKYKGKL